MNNMNETLNFPEAVMLLLKRAYFSECTFVDELDEQGNPKIDLQGKTIKRAKHQNDITFKIWCEQYGLILNQNKIIDPSSQPLKIIKP